MGGVMRPVFSIVQAEGFELKQRGNTWRGLCPLHDRDGRNPSFVCGEDWFYCHSCKESGDGAAFIMRLKGFNYFYALEYLGEEVRIPSRQEKAKRDAERKQRAEAQWREREVARTLGVAIRRIHEAMTRITPETLDDYAPMLAELSHLEYQHDLMIHGTPEDKAAVVAEWHGIKLFERTLLFKKNFDYRKWLRATLQKPEPPPEVNQESENGVERASISFV